jgi:hypothetical protein
MRGLVSLPGLALSCRRSHRPRYRRWPDPTNGFVSFRLDPPEFAGLLRTAKAWNVTLNDLLIAVMLLTLSPLAEKRETARRRIYLAAASIINIRSEVGADARDYFGQFLSSFRVAHLVPEGIALRELAQDIHAQTTRWKKRRLYLQTLVVMFYSSIVWRFLGLDQRQRFHVKNWPVWVGVTMLNVDALWREGAPPDLAALRARGFDGAFVAHDRGRDDRRWRAPSRHLVSHWGVRARDGGKGSGRCPSRFGRRGHGGLG